MKLCNDTITVFNKRFDTANRWNDYVPTIISGVSWFSRMKSSVGDNGLRAANEFIVRIPDNADFGGKTYVDEATYKQETIVSGVFTLAEGDIVVKGAIDYTVDPETIQENHADCFTILSVTDNRRAPNAKHFRVVGA